MTDTQHPSDDDAHELEQIGGEFGCHRLNGELTNAYALRLLAYISEMASEMRAVEARVARPRLIPGPLPMTNPESIAQERAPPAAALPKFVSHGTPNPRELFFENPCTARSTSTARRHANDRTV